MNRPITTLFLLSSVDGKISTWDNNRDTDKDFHKIKGIKEWLQQYYDIEQTTDLHSLNSGKVMAKIGINEKEISVSDMVSFIIIDHTHLNTPWVKNLANSLKKLYLITSNKQHPAFTCKNIENLEIIYYQETIDFPDALRQLKEKYNINKITIQSGGTLNTIFIREKLIDKLSLVVAPALIWWINTTSIIGGTSLSSKEDLKYIKALKLTEVEQLNNSYIHLKYDLINDTIIDS